MIQLADFEGVELAAQGLEHLLAILRKFSTFDEGVVHVLGLEESASFAYELM